MYDIYVLTDLKHDVLTDLGALKLDFFENKTPGRLRCVRACVCAYACVCVCARVRVS
jgi:hypothetical protein